MTNQGVGLAPALAMTLGIAGLGAVTNQNGAISASNLAGARRSFYLPRSNASVDVSRLF